MPTLLHPLTRDPPPTGARVLCARGLAAMVLPPHLPSPTQSPPLPPPHMPCTVVRARPSSPQTVRPMPLASTWRHPHARTQPLTHARPALPARPSTRAQSPAMQLSARYTVPTKHLPYIEVYVVQLWMVTHRRLLVAAKQLRMSWHLHGPPDTSSCTAHPERALSDCRLLKSHPQTTTTNSPGGPNETKHDTARAATANHATDHACVLTKTHSAAPIKYSTNPVCNSPAPR